MSEDPGHKAMLYFLEVLMNSNGPLTISQLAGRFGSRSFTAEMRSAAGGNEVGLKKFLLKYPSLFTVSGNMVSLFDGSKAVSSSPAAEGAANGGGGVTPSGRSLPDVSNEMEAVRFFQNKMAKKEERWIPVKSLAGHLSQAAQSVRNVVGPQLDFRKWLLKHPHIFEVQGELVGLRDGVAAVATPSMTRRSFDFQNGDIPSSPSPVLRAQPPKTPPANRKFPPKSPASVRRAHSFSDKRQTNQAAVHDNSPIVTAPGTPGARRKNAPVTMTANEYKAVMFLKDIIEKRGSIRLHNITGHFSQAAEGVRNTIGWTKMELEEFLKKNSNVFHVSEDEVVTLIKNAKMNVIITGSRPQGQSVRTLTGRKGKVFHVAKLWGIIDLGKHEHVFFDKSIMRKPIEDMQKEYRVGEILAFNAVLAPKTSRAKWRATHVWKESETPSSILDSDYTDSSGALSPAISIEEEINRFLPQQDYDFDDIDKYSDATTSSAGRVPVWNTDQEDEDLNMLSESSFMSSSALNDLRLKLNYTIALPYTSSESSNEDRHAELKLADSPRSAGESASVGAEKAASPEVLPAAASYSASIPKSPVATKPDTAPAAEVAAPVSEAPVTPVPAASAASVPPSGGESDKTPPSKPTVTVTREKSIKKDKVVSPKPAKKFVEAACQTISTGEIIATQLYQE